MRSMDSSISACSTVNSYSMAALLDKLLIDQLVDGLLAHLGEHIVHLFR